MEKKTSLLATTILMLALISAGCSSGPTVAKVTYEDQIIIDAGIKKAYEMGLKPFPMVGEGRGGKFTVVGPAQITFDRNGNWTTSPGDLYINATQNDMVLKGLIVKRGQFAREIHYKLQIVE